MKKLHLLLLAGSMLLSQIVCGQITTPSPYCAAGYDDAAGFAVDHHISNVTLGTLNNTSGSTQYAGAHYAYYNTVAAPTLTKGSSYPLSITHDGGATIHFVAVYIDFNHNNDFTDAGERVLQYTINGAGTIPNPATATVAIPTTAATGITRMRVMVFEDDDYTWTLGSTNATPCTADATGSFDWGETEDYNVNLVSTVATCDTVTGLALSSITGTTAHMAWTAVTGSAGYQYIVNTTAASPTTSGTNTTTTSANATGLLAGTIYYAHVRDSCGAGSFSAWVNKKFTTSMGINDVAEAQEALLNVYPNPVSNTLNVQINGIVNGNASIQIVDVTGRTLLAAGGITNTNIIDVSALQAGIYLIQYNDGINTHVVRFVKG